MLLAGDLRLLVSTTCDYLAKKYSLKVENYSCYSLLDHREVEHFSVIFSCPENGVEIYEMTGILAEAESDLSRYEELPLARIKSLDILFVSSWWQEVGQKIAKEQNK